MLLPVPDTSMASEGRGPVLDSCGGFGCERENEALPNTGCWGPPGKSLIFESVS